MSCDVRGHLLGNFCNNWFVNKSLSNGDHHCLRIIQCWYIVTSSYNRSMIG